MMTEAGTSIREKAIDPVWVQQGEKLQLWKRIELVSRRHPLGQGTAQSGKICLLYLHLQTKVLGRGTPGTESK